MKKGTSKKVICTFLAILLLLFGLYKYNNHINNVVKVTRYSYQNVKIPKAFENFKMLVISDLHNAPFSEQIIDIIYEEKPDIIVLTGDMNQLPDHDIAQITRIASVVEGEIPVYAISGNHEKQCDYYWDIVKELYRSANVCWIEDYGVAIKKDNEKIYLAGVSDPAHDVLGEKEFNKARETIRQEVSESPGFTIVLNHRSDTYPEIKDEGADLILAGHSHGGIIRLPFIGGIIGGEPGSFKFPKYEYGVIKEGDGSTMIVSAGCDQNPKKKRWFNQPEVLLITLESEK